VHDTVIRNGLIVDGTGRPGFYGDVAIDKGRIAQVGGKAARGRREMQADGRLVTPGFIDAHTHYDGQVTWDRWLSPSCWHGVTTVVMGNCGVGFAPARPDKHDWLIGLMEGVEDIPGTALHEGIPWGWETFPEYLDLLDTMPRAIDVGAQATHATIRAYVMGERGAGNEPADSQDLSDMAGLVKEAINAGALGFTSSRTTFHRTRDGQHIPGYEVAFEELIHLARAMGETGTGTLGLNMDFDQVEQDFAWIRKVQQASKRPVWFLLSQFNDNPGIFSRLLDQTAQAAAAGEDIRPQVAGRPIGFILGLNSSLHPFISRPSYKAIAHLPLAERIAMLRDPDFRKKLLAESVEHKSDIMRTVTQRFDRMFRLGNPPNYEPEPQSSVAWIAAGKGLSPAEVALDMLLERDGQEFIFMPAFNYAAGDLSDVRTMLVDPNTVLGLSDAGAHCGLVCDVSTPTFMLTHWARDRTRGPKLALEEVVRAQTSGTAGLYGLADRGMLKAGMKADINIIDFERLSLKAPEMVYDLPAGGKRLIQHATGYAATLVNGEPIFEQGVATGAMPGRLIRGAQRSSA